MSLKIYLFYCRLDNLMNKVCIYTYTFYINNAFLHYDVDAKSISDVSYYDTRLFVSNGWDVF